MSVLSLLCHNSRKEKKKKEKNTSIFDSWCERPKQKSKDLRKLEGYVQAVSKFTSLFSSFIWVPEQKRQQCPGLLNSTPSTNHYFHLSPFFQCVPCCEGIHKKWLDLRNHPRHLILSPHRVIPCCWLDGNVSCHVCFSISLSSSLYWQFP